MPFEQPEGATPLTGEDLEGLLVPARMQDELNRFEAIAIEQARLRFDRARRLRTNFPSDNSLRWMHLEMFGSIWRWAGQYRTTNTNIGDDWPSSSVRVHDLCANVAQQLEATMDRDELCARFHHRLVKIHPFRNGNGRHARLAADVLRRNLGLPRWTWGGDDLVTATQTRQRYIAALRSADAGDIQPLLNFVSPPN